MDTPAQQTARRAQLVARLAAERGHLLQQLEGLSEETLSQELIFEGWPASALLAHLAYWDAFAADRLGKLVDGRRAEIQPIGVGEDTLDARNAALRQRLAGLPFAQAVALCQKERRSLLLALDRLPDDALYRRIQLRPGWRATPVTWAGWSYRHDAEHSADLARWRATYPPNDPVRRVIHRALLRPILGLTRAEFAALAALIPPREGETRPISGAWSLKQVVGHLADYERLGVIALRAVATGREPVYEKRLADFDAYNDRRGAVWAAQPWAEAWATYVAARRALLEVAGGLPDEALARVFPAPWPGQTTACGYLLDMAQHEEEHADSLRRALGLPALPRRLGRAGNIA